MNKTNTELIKLPTEMYISCDGRRMLKGFEMRFTLSEEDFLIVANTIKPQLEGNDLADALLAMLTYGIHKAYEEIEGVPFVLDMDRKRNDC